LKTAAQGPETLATPIEYEPGLVEESVRRAIEDGESAPSGLKSWRLRLDHQRQLDAIYQMPDNEQREAAFRKHFLELFGELGLDAWVPRWLQPFPQLRTDLERVLVRSPLVAAQEGAELWESREQQGQGIPAYLIITLARLGPGGSHELEARLLPELQLAADMLDPEFAFQRGDLRRGTRAEQERRAASYHGLWLLSARARLRARGLIDDPEVADDIEQLDGAELQAPSDTPLHEHLLQLADRLVKHPTAASPTAVGHCPLCRFPTCDWADDDLLRALEGAIRGDLSGWSVGDGCCGQCAEHYELLAT